MLWTTLTIIGAVVVALGAMVALVWWKQERILFQPPRLVPVLDLDPQCTRVEYVAADGQPLFALVVRPGDASRDLLLAFHGNADLAIWLVPWAREVARRTGHTVLLAEYRGYGGLAGAPTYERARLDARAAYTVATMTLGAAPQRIAIFGHSLGSAVAAELAVELADGRAAGGESGWARETVPPRLLILESPFTSARAMARFVVWRPVLATWRLISRVHYDTLSRVSRLDVPVWVAHGTRDFVVPVRMGEEVFGAARRRGEILLVPGAGHNDVADVGGEAYWRWLERALGG